MRQQDTPRRSPQDSSNESSNDTSLEHDVWTVRAAIPHVPIPQVALPDEVPNPPDFSAMPVAVLHSGTVETLLCLNEDLTARLHVNLRRHSILESQIFEHQRVIDELTRTNGAISAQMQILQEKERMWRERTSGIENREKGLHDELEHLKSKLEAAEERKIELREKLRFASSYKRRIARWVQPGIKANSRIRVDLELKLKNLENQLIGREAAMSDLKARLTETFNRLQNLEKLRTKDQTALVDQYEARLQQAESSFARERAEFAKIKSELQLSEQKILRLEQSLTEKIDLENKFIAMERELQDSREQVRASQNEAASLQRRLQDTKAELERALESRHQLSDQLIALQDQFAGLQAVWADTQKRNETLRLSNESLNKLNQELSQSLRRERTSPRSNQAAIEVPRTAAHAGTQVGTVQKLDKIDHLLSELETGLAISFGKSRDSDIHKLDILDDQISS